LPVNIPTKETPFLTTLFTELQKLGQNYCVLRNYSELPYDLKGSDIDILVHRNSLNVSTELIQHSVKAHDGFVAWREWNDCLRIILCFGKDDEDDWWGVPIHLFSDIRWKGITYYPSREVLKNSIIHNEIRGACDFDANLIDMLNKLLYLGASPKADVFSAVVSEPGYSHMIKDRLTPYFGSELESFISTLPNRNFRMMESIARRLRRTLVLRSILKSPSDLFRNKVKRFIVHWQRLRHRSGILVSIFGTDGSGKTTLIDCSRPYLDKFIHSKTFAFHWRPSVLPALVTLTGGQASPPSSFNKPHTKAPSGFLGSLFRLAYYSIDHVIGFWFVIYPKLVRLPTVIFFDRYFHDYYFDSARFRINLPRWILSLFELMIPKPDLGIFLKVSPEVAFYRKPELSVAEHHRQQKQMFLLTRKFKHFEIVCTDGSLAESQKDILTAIIQIYGSL
jgi:thymidylate kinase